MTTPQDPERALEVVEAAMEHAEELRQRSETLAEQWRRSRRDNNFRNMLRQLATRE